MGSSLEKSGNVALAAFPEGCTWGSKMRIAEPGTLLPAPLSKGAHLSILGSQAILRE